MTELIDTTEMYLKTVYELEEDGVPPLRARIVERLDHSGPTVSQTVARMERDGLIKVADDRSLELTDEGRRRATDVIRKHRLAERLLLDVIGIERRFVHEEACRWEHVMSDAAAERMAVYLGNPETSPYGTPIPAANARKVHRLADHGQELRTAAAAGSDEVVFVMVDEHPQTDPCFMAELDASLIRPGSVVTLTAQGEDLVLTGEDGRHSVRVPAEYTGSLRVRARH